MRSLKPSEVTNQYWIYAWAANPVCRETTPRTGKWLVRVRREELDAAWVLIRAAVAAGRLGPAAKTRTAMPGILDNPESCSVICVYTADAEDLADRKRVRRQLTRLGFTRLAYKTDEQTRREWGTCK